MELFRKVKSLLFVIAVITGVYCTLLPSAIAQNQLNVYVVNYPLKYFAETIGGPGHYVHDDAR